jgi:hypothetical protein
MRRIDRKESLSGTTRLAGGFLDTTKAGNPRADCLSSLKSILLKNLSSHKCLLP